MKWIPIKDKKPPVGVFVLATYVEYCQCQTKPDCYKVCSMCKYNAGAYRDTAMIKYNNQKNVLAWQHKPAPYKGV